MFPGKWKVNRFGEMSAPWPSSALCGHAAFHPSGAGFVDLAVRELELACMKAPRGESPKRWNTRRWNIWRWKLLEVNHLGVKRPAVKTHGTNITGFKWFRRCEVCVQTAINKPEKRNDPIFPSFLLKAVTCKLKLALFRILDEFRMHSFVSLCSFDAAYF